MSKVELLELDIYNFSAILGEKVYDGKFKVNWEDNIAEVEITDLIAENDMEELNCVNLVDPTLLVQLEEEIEEFGDHRQWVDDYEEDTYDILNFG